MASSSFTTQPFLSHPLSRTHHKFSPCSKTSPPSQPPTTTPSPMPLSPSLISSTSLEKPITPVELETNDNTTTTTTTTMTSNRNAKKSGGKSSSVDSTDWVATSLTRRFGLGAGLAWVGFLAVGVISEQVKTRLEVSQEQANTRDLEKEEEITLPNGIRYYEMRIGGGATPKPGDLVVIHLKGKVKASGEVFVDTFGKNNRSLALVMGVRPYTRGMCEGVEEVLKTMKAGGKRRVIVPPKLGYCDNGADFGDDVSIPPCSTLEYIVEVDKVSIAPA